MARKLTALIFAASIAVFASPSFAATKVRVCTQNLARVGKPPFGSKKDSINKQTGYLVERFTQAKCDVIAVQEVYGKSKAAAEAILEDLTEALSDDSGVKYVSFVGESQYDEIRNGYILRQNIAKVLSTTSPSSPVLPKLNPLARSRVSTRSPFALLLDIASTKRHLLLLDIHLKSKVGGFKDATGLDFETVRMEGSQQARTFAEGLIREHSGKDEIVALILGDRNSRTGSATDAILQGKLNLEDFRKGCSVKPTLEPSCGAQHLPLFSPLIAPRTSRGSSKFHGQEELIDEIYLASGYLDQLRAAKINLDYGLVGEFFKGSDHKLVWIDLPL